MLCVLGDLLLNERRMAVWSTLFGGSYTISLVYIICKSLSVLDFRQSNTVSSTHSMEETWPVQLSFTVGFCYIQLYPVASKQVVTVLVVTVLVVD